MQGTAFLAIVFLSLFLQGAPSFSLPLSTNKRWIVDQISGQRVKLACLNWPSHLETLLAEGLDKKPLKFIASQLVLHQYNCVRFTFATFMFTRAQYAHLTVEQSFDNLNLTEAKAGITKHNPYLLPMTVLRAYDTIVDVLGAHGLMLVLDNHVSKPKWCCGERDGNAFMNDNYFHPEEWIRGLTSVAKRFKGKSQVIGIGLRNELRGPLQNVAQWYQYEQEAATKVHEANPNVLIMASGLNYATDLSFWKNKTFGSNFDNKLVLEAHTYPWSAGSEDAWVNEPLNNVCATKLQILDNKVGFVNSGENAVPLFFGEFGINQQNVSVQHDHFLSCLLSYAIERDLDWGLWALQGSYYIRENLRGTEETFGILDITWSKIRNPNVQQRLQLMKEKLQDGNGDSSASYIMYHPQSGFCVRAKRRKGLYTSTSKPFISISKWIHDADEAPLRLVGTSYCLKLVGDGQAPILSKECLTKWKLVSNSKLQLAAKDEKGEDLCLHMDSSSGSRTTTPIVTRKCICIGTDPNCKDDPTSQWFKLALTNVK